MLIGAAQFDLLVDVLVFRVEPFGDFLRWRPDFGRMIAIQDVAPGLALQNHDFGQAAGDVAENPLHQAGRLVLTFLDHAKQARDEEVGFALGLGVDFGRGAGEQGGSFFAVTLAVQQDRFLASPSSPS